MLEFGKHEFERFTIDYKATGLKMKQLREERHIAVVDVARHLNKTVQLVYSWEAGTGKIQLNDFVSVCSLFNVSTDKVICEKLEIGVYYDYDE